MGYADLIARERMPDRMVDVELAHSQSQKGMGLGFYRAGAGNDAGRGKWDIVGEHMQILSVALAPGEQLESEPGGMMYMSDGVKAEADFSCPGACVRCLGGERCVLMHYKNSGGKPGFVGITPARPADIVALDLATYGNKISARSGAHLSVKAQQQPDPARQDRCHEPPTADIAAAARRRHGNGVCGSRHVEAAVEDIDRGNRLIGAPVIIKCGCHTGGFEYLVIHNDLPFGIGGLWRTPVLTGCRT